MRFLPHRRRHPRSDRSFLEPLARQWYPQANAGRGPSAAVLAAAADARQCTALMYAAAGASFDAVHKLLPHSDLNARDVTGKTALHYALLSGNQRVAVLLLRRGAEVDAADEHGCTALMLASLLGYHAIVQQLLLKGAKPELVDSAGRDSRAYAAAGRSSDIIALLGCSERG